MSDFFSIFLVINYQVSSIAYMAKFPVWYLDDFVLSLSTGLCNEDFCSNLLYVLKDVTDFLSVLLNVIIKCCQL